MRAADPLVSANLSGSSGPYRINRLFSRHTRSKFGLTSASDHLLSPPLSPLLSFVFDHA